MTATADNHELVIGIDVGGTKIAAGLVEFPAVLATSRQVIRTDANRGGASVLDDVVQLAAQLCAESTRQGRQVGGIGLGICELVDRNGNLASEHCIQWLDQPVRQRLSEIAPLVIEADVRAAALAEAIAGEGRSFETFLYVTIGTGISCCLMQNGRAHLGAHGFTGTMASSPLTHHCESCGHIDERTLEGIAAGPALLARFNAVHGSASTSEEVVRTAASGHPIAAQVIRSASEALGAQIGMLINVLDPEAVILGGGIGVSDGFYQTQLTASIRRHIWSQHHRDLPVVRAKKGADAGWIGAAAAAHRQLFCSEPLTPNVPTSATS
jgi:glucokinase